MKLYLEKLKAIRKYKKFTIEELASKIGIGRMTLSAWENAKRIPSESKIRALAKALDVQINEISDLPADKIISEISLTGIGKSVKSLVSTGKEKYLQRQKHLVSDIASIIKELSDANTIINAMISFLPSIFYIKDTNLNYVAVSEEFLENISLHKNYDVIEKNDYDFFSQKEAKFNHEMDRRVLMTGKSILNKEEYIPGNRRSKWGIMSKIPIMDSEGKIEGVLGYFIDITQRRKVEEELNIHQLELELINENLQNTQFNLEESRKKYYELFDLAPFGYLKLDQKGIIIQANFAASEILGIEKIHIIDRKFTDFIAYEYQDEFYKIFSKKTEVNEKCNCKLMLKTPKGNSPVQINLCLIRNSLNYSASYLLTINSTILNQIPNGFN